MKTALFILSLFSFTAGAGAQAANDTVEVLFSPPPQIDSTYAIISVVIKPKGNSATSYFQLNDGRTFDLKSFSGMGDAISSSFKIDGLKPGTAYELKFITFSNNDNKKSCGSSKINFTTKSPKKSEASANKKRRR